MVREAGFLRTRDLREAGIPRVYLARLCEQGQLEKVARGLYRLAGAETSEKYTLAQAAKRVPEGVICLLTALRFHELGAQNPFQIWMAIGSRSWKPTLQDFPVRFHRFSMASLAAGVKEHVIDGVRVRIFDREKTVVDCFKFRNKIGLEVALEALEDLARRPDMSIDALWTYANICRVRNVMKPYLEAMRR